MENLNYSCSLSELSHFLEGKGFKILEFDFEDLETLLALPFYHQDPFDRLIIAQSKTKSLNIITDDRQVKGYFSVI